MKKKLVALALVAAMAISTVACGSSSSSSSSSDTTTEESTDDAEESTTTSSADAIKLNLSVPDSASSSICVAAEEFAAQLNEKSEGRLEVTVYPDASLYGGDATAAITTMQSGGLDMLCLATSW